MRFKPIQVHGSTFLDIFTIKALLPPANLSGYCFFKSFWRTHVLFWGPLVPLFWISSDVASGFQSQSGFCLICICRGEYNVHSLISTSDATQLVTSPHACAEVGLGSDSNGQSPGQKMNLLPLCQRPYLVGR